ncbi:MAG: adenylate/guanylate cyclase domain-containing protein, partial [Nitrospinota bacterium]
LAAGDWVFILGNTPHILQQMAVPPGGSREEAIELPPGAYRVRSPQGRAYASLRTYAPAIPGERRLEIELGPGGLTPPQTDLPGGMVRVSCRNRTAGETLFVLEHTAWADDAATGLDVAFFERYRRLFGADAFRAGEGLAVQNVALLFTDLKGSTALYEAAGDASAYGRVRDHFGILREAIQKNHGGLVKTIGDGAMASFKSAEDAVRAGIAMHAGIARWNAARGVEPLILKMGVHAGHALVVNSNDRLDFFGRMVNVTARIQEASQGGDIVLTQPVFENPAAAALLAAAPHREEPFSLNLRGLEGSFPLKRIWPLAG